MLVSKILLSRHLEMMMGGRAAEDIIYKEISTGASNDLRKSKRNCLPYGL